MPRLPFSPETDQPIANIERLAEIQPQVSPYKQFYNSLVANTASALTAKTQQWFAKRELEPRGGEKLPASKLNEMYPGLEAPFTEPTSHLVAQATADIQYEKRSLNAQLARGPDGFWTGKVPTFAGALLAHVADPMELTIGVATGSGLGSLARAGYLGAGATALYESAAPLARAGQSLAEGVVGGVATEAPSAALSKYGLQEDYDTGDAVAGVFKSAMAFSIFHYGAGAVMTKMRAISPEAAEASVRVSRAQAMSDKSIDLELMSKAGPHPEGDPRNVEIAYGHANEGSVVAAELAPARQITKAEQELAGDSVKQKFNELAAQENAPSRRMDFDEEAHSEAIRISQEPIPDTPQVSNMKDFANQRLMELDALIQDGRLSAEEIKTVERIKQAQAAANSDDGVLMGLFDCMLGAR